MKDKYKEIISNINKFFVNFFEKCPVYPINQNDFNDINQLLYFASAKSLILDRIINFFEESKNYFMDKLKSEEEEYISLIKIAKINLIKLEESVKKDQNFEKLNNIYENWRKNNNFIFEESSLDNLKKYLKKYIKQKLNLEMMYTYDSKFCLWAIKNNYEKYFTA